MPEKQTVVLLGGRHDTTWFVYNALKDQFNIEKVILESGGGSRKKFLQRRIKRLGIWVVAGQILFVLLCSKWLKMEASARIREIKQKMNLDDQIEESSKVVPVPSVNSESCREELIKSSPKVVIVNGTGIIGKKTLQCTNAIYINTHVGITPEYRGVHGGYWALACNDKENCGVTVHLVDTGIDTGSILYQSTIEPAKKDNFKSYIYLQYGAAIPLLKKAVQDALLGSLSPFKKEGASSKLWYHPTLWFYLRKRWFRGVK